MLNVDLFFHKALREDADIIEVTGGRLYNTGRPDKDETEDRVPYVIISYDGGSAGESTKDFEVTPLAAATVSLLCVAADRESLADLTDMVYAAVENEMESIDWDAQTWAFRIEGCTPAASAVQYDPDKPCYFQTLTYQCDTNPI